MSKYNFDKIFTSTCHYMLLNVFLGSKNKEDAHCVDKSRILYRMII